MLEPAQPDPGSEPGQAILAVSSVLAQVGCLTLASALGALAAGLWLDRALGTRPVFTILLLVGSVPVTLYLTVRLVLRGTRHLNPPRAESPGDEERQGGGNAGQDDA